MTESEAIKLARLEEKVKSLEGAQSRLWKEVTAMKDSVSSMSKSMNRIQWVFGGMALLYLVQTIGLDEVLKKIVL